MPVKSKAQVAVPGPAPEPEKPPATCQCFHAPEQHSESGCGVVAIMSGRCPCEWKAGSAHHRDPQRGPRDTVWREDTHVRAGAKLPDNRFDDLRALLSELRRSLRDARGKR